METVEVIIYIGIALIVGALVVGFIGSWDAQGTFKGLKSLFKPEPDDRFEEITSDRFAKSVLDTWEACGLGTSEMNKTIYVSDTSLLNKSLIFSRVKQANLCRTLQSQEYACGVREDVDFENTTGPRVLTLRCESGIMLIS
jgi:hypothetical protein